jgi:hypothetical protein
MPSVHVQRVQITVRGVKAADVRRGAAGLRAALARAIAAPSPAGPRAPLAERIAGPLAETIRRALRGDR